MKKWKLPSFIKKPAIFILSKLGHKEVSVKGISNTVREAVYTRVGLENGSMREHWTEKALKKIPAGKRILDAGAGQLRFRQACSHLHYTSQDIGTYDGKGTGEGVQVGSWDNSKLDIVCDIVNIPVKDQSYDAILCTEVFEHISEPAKAVKEFSRILVAGGTLIITAPFCSLTHFAPYYFANGYSKYWYQKILPEYGFEIREITPNGNFFEYLGQEIRNIKANGQRYAKINSKYQILLKISELIMLRVLARFSKNDIGSNELLCFGLLIKAVKK